MVGERGSRRTLGATPTNRSRLSNITNLVNSSSWSNENEHVKNTYHTNEFQLQQVNDRLPLGHYQQALPYITLVSFTEQRAIESKQDYKRS